MSERLYAQMKGTAMILLMGAILLTILVVGTAALSGHPLYLIAAATMLAGVILAATRRTGEQR